MPLAYYQPKFILDQIVAACQFDGKEPRIDEEYLQDCLDNLHARPRETRSAHEQPPILAEVRAKPAAVAGARG
jgi:hypothetical protein